jgi:transforming growth factor-beta-induced protein
MKKEILILFICLCMAGVFIAGCTTPTTPPVTPTPTATPVPTTALPTTMTPAKTIISTAVADGRFTTLVAAIQAANLSGTLSGPGPFTVFAPTDDAFKNLPNGTVQALLQDPKGQLTQILLYHVVPGEYLAADIVNMTTLQTLQGGNLTINATGGAVYVNNAKIVQADIMTQNGVIHVIDAVLIPPATNTTNATGM